ncbi:MAG: imm11 family protein, partial [Shimia sp.]|uniref:imm11 family protein n=1 Tax=Shimia sp. TaxID=1954381 RepID=UPI0040588996
MPQNTDHKLPPLEVRLQKPEIHRTAYVLLPQLIDYDVFPMEEVPRVGPVKRRIAGYPRKGTLLDIKGNLDGTKIYRHSEVAERPDLFGDFHLGFDKPQRHLPDVLELSGMALVSRAFMEAVQEIDPEGGHQFVPCKMVALDGTERSDLQYYHFLCGRIAYLPDEQSRRDLIRSDMGNAYVEAVIDSLDRARFLSQLPIWCTVSA